MFGAFEPSALSASAGPVLLTVGEQCGTLRTAYIRMSANR